MSGFAGIYHRDGAPIEKRLLEHMTESLAFRGPDGCKTWIRGEIGLGHTLLRTAEDFPEQQQPLSLDGEVWIVADARIDARAELVDKLDAKRRTPVARALDDAGLILEAYETWGERCVDHLLGDFALVIWDGRRKRLFGARDHLGVKPFYFAEKGHHFVFSNTLDCLRLHPEISSTLNERAVADFLLFDLNHEPGTTTFADIQRLPPAHLLICDTGGTRVERYWTLALGDTIHYSRSEDYVERFRELLRTAVADRLRTRSVGVFMTGGMDSTSVAATAQQVLKANGAPFDLRAYTEVYERLLPDEERHYAGLVADALGIPIHYVVGDDYRLFERWDRVARRAPEPEMNSVVGALFSEEFALVAAHSRVLLNGNGADPLFVASLRRHLLGLLRQRHFGSFIADAMQVLAREPGSLFKGLWARLRQINLRPNKMPYPEWLDPDQSVRLGLRSRWETMPADEAPSDHPRSWLLASLNNYFWAHLFEGYDPGTTHVPVEVRYPYFDLRLVSYMLAVPPVPWCLRKRLSREAMRGALPEAVRRRPKALMAADPVRKRLEESGLDWISSVPVAPGLRSYVRADWELAPDPKGEWGDSYWINLRVVALNLWLHSQASFDITKPRTGRETHDESSGKPARTEGVSRS